MKKNKMMRLASAMMVLTLMSTSVISGTFAKYVTSDSASDSARVAKWGVTVLASGSLFGKNYVPNSAADNKDEISATAQQSVDTSEDDNIVAPGTKSAEGLVLAIKGTPEVAYKVEMASVAGNNKDIWLAAGTYGVMVNASSYVNEDNFDKYYVKEGANYAVATGTYDSTKPYYELHDEVVVTENETSTGKYYPLIWTVTDKNSATTTYRQVANMVTALEAIEVPVGVPNVAMDNHYVVTWHWPFGDQQDGADTILGNLQADGGEVYKVVKLSGTNYVDIAVEDYNLTVGFNAQITVTQID